MWRKRTVLAEQQRAVAIPRPGSSAAGFDLISSESRAGPPRPMAPQRVFKTLMEPYDLACENRTGFLGMITDGGHVVRTALQREDFVRIVLAGQLKPPKFRTGRSHQRPRCPG